MMAMAETRFHTMPDGTRTAFRHIRGTSPAIVFLPGYMSDMSGSKAGAVFDWAEGAGRECLLLDYSGCGESDGEFADGSLSRWCDEGLAVIRAQVSGPVVLVGSSMGGWLMLLAGLALGEKLAGLVGIAAAPDFSEWGYNEAQQALLASGETIFEPNPYGPEPTPTHARFWQDAQDNRLLDGPVALNCPVRLLHGQEDRDVPLEISLRLAAAFTSTDVQVTLVKGGDHRLSRDSDIALLLRTVESLI